MAKNSFDSASLNSLDLNQLKRWLVISGVVLAVGLLLLLLTWNTFFVYVPPGKHLLTIAKNGAPLKDGHVLAAPGEQGVLESVQGEGWHFVLPVAYVTELEDNTEIKPGMVGVVTALGGEPLKPGQALAEPGEKGVLRQVLPPGSYRLNLRGFAVKEMPATMIDAGYIGVLRRRRSGGVDDVNAPAVPLETPPTPAATSDGNAADEKRPDEKVATEKASAPVEKKLVGVERRFLQPGLYYLNPEEFEVIMCDVGIFQTTFRYDENPQESSAITFLSEAFDISMDCTVEWELRPEKLPALVAEYGDRDAIERNVIDVQAHSIGRNKGVNYPVQSFLEGSKREEFQNDFTQQLTKVCAEKDVAINSAFIRNIVIPEVYLSPIREKQISAETTTTNKAKIATAESVAKMEKEKQMIDQRTAEVVAETQRLVAGVERDILNLSTKTEAEIERMSAETNAKIALIDAQKTQLVGQATAEVKGLTETAKSKLYQMKLDVFNGDGVAFVRYSISQKLNPKLLLRVFHSGPGTFWTNLGDKNVNLMLPAGASGSQSSEKPAAAAIKKSIESQR